MKQLDVPLIPELHLQSPLSHVSERLDHLPQQPIRIAPWAEDNGNVEVGFALAYNKDCLFLKYKVREEAVLARYRNINDPVYQDSCVEFFIAFGDDHAYYNIEANCLGTCRVGYGPAKYDRVLLPTETVAGIEHHAHLRALNHGQARKHWELTLKIPASVFTAHRLESFAGQPARGNFYKCGDDLPKPHFLVWHPVTAPEPDFHRPEHFGRIAFL